MRAIGIDLSLRFTGCVAIDVNLKVMGHCLIKPENIGYSRVVTIVDSVRDFILDLSGGPRCAIGIEDYIIGRGFKSGMDILKAQGAVVSMLKIFNTPCYMIHPGRLRHFQKHGPDLVDATGLSEHEVDAWGLAVMALAAHEGIPSDWPKSLKEIINKLVPVY